MLVENQVAVITGGASGIGVATAKRYADHGAHVVVADVDEDGGRETVAAILDTGAEATFEPTEVTQADDGQEMSDTAVEEYGDRRSVKQRRDRETVLGVLKLRRRGVRSGGLGQLQGGVPGHQVRDSGDARPRRYDPQYIFGNRRLRDSRSRRVQRDEGWNQWSDAVPPATLDQPVRLQVVERLIVVSGGPELFAGVLA